MLQMTEEMLHDKMAQMIRVGIVNARQPEKMRVKVTIPDTTTSPLVTDWLPVLCPRASQDMQYDLPDVGDQVLCLFLAYGLEQGFVVGAMYGKQQPPVQNGDKWHRKFKDGTYLEYDRAEHKLVANVQGDVEILATGNMQAQIKGNMAAQSDGPAAVSSKAQLSLDAPAMNMGGGDGSATSAAMQGTFNLTRGDIIAETVSLRNHVHVCPACGATTSPPVGGGSDSGSTGGGNAGNGDNGNGDNTSKLPEAVATALEATAFVWTPEREAQFEETKKKVHQQDNEVFDTILCLPRIAESEASKQTSENDKLGWLYLKQMFEKWLSAKANKDPYKGGEPFWVSMDWVLSYTRAWAEWQIITLDFSLFTEKSKKLLFEIIKKAGLSTNRREYFKFTQLPWTLWNDYYFQSYRVPGMFAIPPDGLMAAMGDFNFRALADGIIEPSKNGYWITVEKVGIIVWDSFNFEGEFPLYYWSCPHEAFQILDPDEAIYLYNSNFRKFQDETGCGSDFLVLSKPKKVDTFEGFAYYVEL